MDIRQTQEWGKYLSQIGWKIELVGKTQIFIRTFPFIGRSAIKIQHPKNPLPYPKIDAVAKKHKALFVLIEPEPFGFSESDLTTHGYKRSSMSLTHTATIHLDLRKTKDELFASFSENARRNIKKAQKNNLTTRIVLLKNEVSDHEFRKFYDLLSNLTKLKKFFVPGYGEFHKKMLGFKDSSAILFADNEKGEPIAAVWLGILDDSAVYMNTGITEEGYNSLANYLLVWEALQFAKKLGLKLFDFEGIFDPRFPKQRPSWKNFSEFKKRFHGTLIEYPGPLIKWYSRPFELLYLCSKIFYR